MVHFDLTTFDGSRVSGLPCAGPVTSAFGDRDIPSHANGHTGVDIGASAGTRVLAPASGTVQDAFSVQAETVPWRVAWCAVFGNSVILNHGDFVTLYGHLRDAPLIRSGVVNQGDQIGNVGSTGDSTGPHLHWGMAPASNPYVQRQGLGGLVDPLNFIAGEVTPPAEPSDHSGADIRDGVDVGLPRLSLEAAGPLLRDVQVDLTRHVAAIDTTIASLQATRARLLADAQAVDTGFERLRQAHREVFGDGDILRGR